MPLTTPDDPDIPIPRHSVATNIPVTLPPSLRRRPSRLLQRPRKRSRPLPNPQDDPTDQLFNSLSSLSDTALACQTLHSTWPQQALLSLPRTPPLILFKQIHALISDPTVIDDEVDGLARADYRKIRLPTSEEALVLLADFDRIPKSKIASRFVRELLPRVKSPVVSQRLIDAHFEDDVSAVLVREGLLTMRDEISFWLAIPDMGEILRNRRAGNAEILALLKKAPYQEMLLEKLECRTLKNSLFTAQWHVRDVVGGGKAETVATSLGTLVRVRMGDA